MPRCVSAHISGRVEHIFYALCPALTTDRLPITNHSHSHPKATRRTADTCVSLWLTARGAVGSLRPARRSCARASTQQHLHATLALKADSPRQLRLMDRPMATVLHRIGTGARCSRPSHTSNSSRRSRAARAGCTQAHSRCRSWTKSSRKSPWWRCHLGRCTSCTGRT